MFTVDGYVVERLLCMIFFLWSLVYECYDESLLLHILAGNFDINVAKVDYVH